MMRHADVLMLRGRLEQLGIDVPAPIVRALELLELSGALLADTPSTVLGLSDDEARAWIREQSIRTHSAGLGQTGYTAGAEAFLNAVMAELRDATLPFMDQIITDLQPRFAQLVEPIVAGARTHGFTARTTSDQVIDMRTAGAVEAWRASKRAQEQIAPIVSLRQTISRAFDLSPTASDMGLPMTNEYAIDWSVCFAEGENFGLDRTFYTDHRGRDGFVRGDLDWNALALGGLRLNTTEDVARKLGNAFTLKIRAIQAQTEDSLEA